MESWRFAAWRARFTETIQGPRALEVGIGTGKNIPFYPAKINITGIDFSTKMLLRARKRADKMGLNLDLKEMDVQHLRFSDHSFDTVFATFVFCSVPDPVTGLKEMRRVCKPDGRLLLLEHMRPGNPFLSKLFDALNPLVVRIMGANINRKTTDNIRRAGWHIESEASLSGDIMRWIIAHPNPKA
jgi:ubiquinone/menaquinone biosynthesis C-methylase UbiE